MALQGRFALVEYDVPGPLVVHERWILEHVEGDDYVVCTPDRDIFVETLTVDNDVSDSGQPVEVCQQGWPARRSMVCQRGVLPRWRRSRLRQPWRHKPSGPLEEVPEE